jgi:hypothetical protein
LFAIELAFGAWALGIVEGAFEIAFDKAFAHPLNGCASDMQRISNALVARAIIGL